MLFRSIYCIACLTALLKILSFQAAEASELTSRCEALGDPVVKRGLWIQFVTQDAEGNFVGWASMKGAGVSELVGVRIDNGAVRRVNLLQFGQVRIVMMKAADGNICAYAGDPGRFIKYDVKKEKLVDLGVPAKRAHYWTGGGVGPDGRLYVGTGPGTRLVACDPATGRIEDLGSMTTDPREYYIIGSAISEDNVIYCPVGLHHQELWAMDLKTRSKQQILPKEFMPRAGAPTVWVGTDGRVYGKSEDDEFLCRPDGIELGKTARRRPEVYDTIAGDWIVSFIDQEGRLHLRHSKTGQEKMVRTSYRGASAQIYCIGCVHEGRLYGGSISPAHVFTLDLKTDQLSELGGLTSGTTQVYDILSHPRGLFLASYTGGGLDFFDPQRPLKKGINPRLIAQLERSHQQERPVELTRGPDGMIYAGTFPIKGHLGGALVRLNPQDFSVKVWRNIVPNQSIVSCAAIPEKEQLFVVSSVEGGSSAIPTEKEAVAFLWNVRTEKIEFQVQPVPGVKTYGKVVRARNGLIYGLAGQNYALDTYYAFDPKQRRVVMTASLPVRAAHWPGLSAEPVGPQGKIYGLGDDAIFVINPSTHRAEIVLRDKSLADAYGFRATDGEDIYYGSKGTLMRCRLGGRP
jgi:outer membrane protein assembly factor BamB